jgi:hypothetical protein
MEHWRSARGLLELYSIDVSKSGAKYFIELAELLSLLNLFPEYGITSNQVFTEYLREEKISPLVFWSNMKRCIKPLLDADDECLNALGIPEPGKRTCPAMVISVAAALSDGMDKYGRDKFADVAWKVAQICGAEKNH